MLLYNLVNRIYCINLDYFNRAPTTVDLDRVKTSSNTDPTLLKRIGPFLPSFFCAALGSCGIGYFLEKHLNSIKLVIDGNKKIIAKSFFFRHPALRMGLPPSIALSAGHMCDLLFSRFPEIYRGSLLFHINKDGELKKSINKDGTQATSKIGGTLAVSNTWLQRSLTAFFVLMTNALAMNHIQRRFPMIKEARLLPILLAACGLSCYFGLALTQAYLGSDCMKISKRFVNVESMDSDSSYHSYYQLYKGK